MFSLKSQLFMVRLLIEIYLPWDDVRKLELGAFDAWAWRSYSPSCAPSSTSSSGSGTRSWSAAPSNTTRVRSRSWTFTVLTRVHPFWQSYFWKTSLYGFPVEYSTQGKMQKSEWSDVKIYELLILIGTIQYKLREFQGEIFIYLRRLVRYLLKWNSFSSSSVWYRV